MGLSGLCQALDRCMSGRATWRHRVDIRQHSFMGVDIKLTYDRSSEGWDSSGPGLEEDYSSGHINLPPKPRLDLWALGVTLPVGRKSSPKTWRDQGNMHKQGKVHCG